MVRPWFATDRPRSEKKLAAARCDKLLSGAWWGFGRVHGRLSGNPSKRHMSVAPPRGGIFACNSKTQVSIHIILLRRT